MGAEQGLVQAEAEGGGKETDEGEEIKAEKGNGKLNNIADFIHRKYSEYRRYYTPSMSGGEISKTHDIYGVSIYASDYYQYIDIIGLGKDEQTELEEMLAEKRK